MLTEEDNKPARRVASPTSPRLALRALEPKIGHRQQKRARCHWRLRREFERELRQI